MSGGQSAGRDPIDPWPISDRVERTGSNPQRGPAEVHLVTSVPRKARKEQECAGTARLLEA